MKLLARPHLVVALLAALAPTAIAQPRPPIPPPTPRPPAVPTPTTPTVRAPLPSPTPPRLARSLPWRFEDAGDLLAWVRTGSFGGDAAIRCPTDRPHRSDTLAVARTAQQLGGNYWSVPLLRDGHGCWFESGPGRGQATSPEITVTARYLHFRLGGSPTTRVELHAYHGSGFIRLRDWRADPSGQPRMVVHDLEENYPNAYLGKRIKLVLVDDSDPVALQLDTVGLADRPPPNDPPPQLWGFADLHTHPMNHIGFGGRMFHGTPHASITSTGTVDTSWTRTPNANPAAKALPACGVAHGNAPGGGTLLVGLDASHHQSGFPDFIGWPHHTTKLHQQMYVDWLRRAWAGGLRVMHADVGNSHLLATLYAALPQIGGTKLPNPITDDWNITVQAKAMKLLVEQPDVASFAAIATSSADVRRIVAAGKLAIVLGVEVEDFGELTKKLAGKTPEDSRPIIRGYLEHLHGLGIRHLFPVHLIDNVFGGTAVYSPMFVAASVLERGKMTFRNAHPDGVRLRLDHALDQSFALLAILEKVPGLGGLRQQLQRDLLLDQQPLGHANDVGLTEHGVVLLQELMRAGFIIDVDHMSDRAVDRTLDVVGDKGYPVVASHTAVRDMMFGAPTLPPGTLGTAHAEAFANERARSRTQLERIRDLGGMVGLGTGASVAPYAYPARAPRTRADCDGSTKSMVQSYLYLVEHMRGQGVAIGTDMNGLPDTLVPRFGPSACRASAGDATRAPHLRAQVDAQRDGVRYRDARKHNYGRFTPAGGHHPYDGFDATTWAGIEKFRAGLGGQPWADLTRLEQRKADRIAYGLFLQHQHLDAPLVTDQLDDRSDIRRAQQLYIDVHRNRPSTDPFVVRMRRIWDAFHRIEGTNPPLAKSTLGTTDFDFNLDGLAHYGLLPDMLQDFRNIGLTDTDLAPLFHGVEYYARMWERIEAASAVVRQELPR